MDDAYVNAPTLTPTPAAVPDPYAAFVAFYEKLRDYQTKSASSGISSVEYVTLPYGSFIRVKVVSEYAAEEDFFKHCITRQLGYNLPLGSYFRTTDNLYRSMLWVGVTPEMVQTMGGRSTSRAPLTENEQEFLRGPVSAGRTAAAALVPVQLPYVLSSGDLRTVLETVLEGTTDQDRLTLQYKSDQTDSMTFGPCYETRFTNAAHQAQCDERWFHSYFQASADDSSVRISLRAFTRQVFFENAFFIVRGLLDELNVTAVGVQPHAHVHLPWSGTNLLALRNNILRWRPALAAPVEELMPCSRAKFKSELESMPSHQHCIVNTFLHIDITDYEAVTYFAKIPLTLPEAQQRSYQDAFAAFMEDVLSNAQRAEAPEVDSSGGVLRITERIAADEPAKAITEHLARFMPPGSKLIVTSSNGYEYLRALAWTGEDMLAEAAAAGVEY